MIEVSEKVKAISKEIVIKAANEAAHFPIDRDFIIPYLKEILSLNPVEFVFHNLEQVNPTYTNLLFLCLPEIWESIDIEDLEYIAKNLSNDLSYFTLIEFTYKYLEIDILQEIIQQAKKNGFYEGVKQYLENQWNVIIKTFEDVKELEVGLCQEIFHYNPTQWSYIHRKLLSDRRVSPALHDFVKLENYIKKITA